MQEHFILDNILSGEELLWIYHRLIETPSWTLSRTSSGPGRNMLPFMGFPGLNVETKGDIHNEFFAGYFRSILFRVKHALKRDFSAQIPPEVLRIHVGAKSSFSKTEFHIDSDNKSYWTILGFLNPVWNAKDGGEFYLADEKIEYKAGRFVVFPSSVKHDGGYVINETLSYWRIAVNIILRPSTADNSAAY
jgi:hypothetical protein